MPRALVISLPAVAALALSGGGGAEGATLLRQGRPEPDDHPEEARRGRSSRASRRASTSSSSRIPPASTTSSSSRAGTTVRKTTHRVRGPGDVDGQDQAREDVPLLLLIARVADEPHLQGALTEAPSAGVSPGVSKRAGGSSGAARPTFRAGSTRPSSIRQAASSPVWTLRITYGRPSHRPMFSTSVRDGRGGLARCEWKTASS